MRVVNLTQGTKDWRDWRGKGLGASDAPVVMGVSPWQTPFELWTVKTGLCQPSEPHPAAIAAMRRGNDLEPKARELAEKQYGMKFEAVAGEHDEYAFIRASLDGYNAESNTILEIKCPGKADHAKALKGQVPEKYMAQLQTQFLVTGATRGIYFSWDGLSEQGVGIEVLPDPAYMARIQAALCEFWLKVEMQVPPKADREELGKLAKRLIADSKRLLNTVTAMELLSGAL